MVAKAAQEAADKTADAIDNVVPGGLAKKALWPVKAFKKVSDKLGAITTVSGLLLVPFICGAAGFAAAAASGGVAAPIAATAVTNSSILTSFYNILITNPLTGATGIMPGLENMGNGAVALTSAFGNVVGAGYTAATTGTPLLPGITEALNAPFAPALAA